MDDGRAWLQQWLARSLSGESSSRGYRLHVEQYLQPHLGAVPLTELRPRHVRAMLQAIAADHARTGRPLSAATLQRIRATLRTALNAAIREELLAGNPARHVQLAPAVRPHPLVWTTARTAAWRRTGARPAVAVWTAAQTAQFLTAIAGDPLHACYHVIALRGLRRGEAAGLTWSHVDLDDATLTVSQQLLEYDGRLVVSPPKSAASARTLPLDSHTVAVLHAHQLCAAEAGRNVTDGFVFTRPDGRPCRPDYLSRHFRQLSSATGLPPVRLHDLRHGAATLMLAAGADLKVVQDLLGHASIVLTADTYTSVLPELARDAAEATAELILQAARTPPGHTPAPRGPHPTAAHGAR